MALPAPGDKRRVYSRHTDSCPSATFIYKTSVKSLTVGAVEEKLREKLTFPDLTGARSPGATPLSADQFHCLLVSGGVYDMCSCTHHCFEEALGVGQLTSSKGPLAKELS